MPITPTASSFGRFSPVHFRISTDAIPSPFWQHPTRLSNSTEVSEIGCPRGFSRAAYSAIKECRQVYACLRRKVPPSVFLGFLPSEVGTTKTNHSECTVSVMKIKTKSYGVSPYYSVSEKPAPPPPVRVSGDCKDFEKIQKSQELIVILNNSLTKGGVRCA